MNRAMAADPQHRFESLTQLRHALEAFLRHRPSHHLTQHALEAHREFTRSIESAAEDFIIRELFATAYTAYGMARTFWSRNPVVAQNLEQILREMIQYETDHGSPDRALDLLGRLSTPDPDLLRRIETSQEFPTIPRLSSNALVDTATRTQKLGGPMPAAFRESEEQVRGRRIFMVSMVIVWSMFGFAFAAIDVTTDVTVTNKLLGAVALVGWVVLAAIAAAMSRVIFTAGAAKNVLAPIGAVIAGSAALLLTYGNGSSPQELVVAHLFLFFVAMSMLNTWFDWRLIASSATYLLAFFAGSFWPETAYTLLGLSNLIGLGVAGYLIDQRLTGVVA